MRLLARTLGGVGLTALVVAGLVGTPTVALATSPVVGHVYINDNTAGTNTIGGFDEHADGSLTPLAGSPFAAGRHVPQPQCLITPRRDERAAIRGKTHAGDSIGHCAKGLHHCTDARASHLHPEPQYAISHLLQRGQRDDDRE